MARLGIYTPLSYSTTVPVLPLPNILPLGNFASHS